MNETLVLQARTSSSRLPAKVLLPVGKMPLAVLAAKRASNRGLPLVVATSVESSDDALCQALEEWNLAFFRGSLNDPLNRFVEALSNQSDEHVVVRLTADNVLPDGELIAALLTAFYKRSVPYLVCGGEESGLPYGVSVEVTRLKYLRTANLSATAAYDREHITPWISRNLGKAVFDAYKSLNMEHYRCTVDTFEDYQKMAALFLNEADPVEAPLSKLIEKLKNLPGTPITLKPAKRFVLGTAQMGMNYGIANSSGAPSQEVSERIIKTCLRSGSSWIETAREYESSEQIIGSSLKGGWDSQAKVVTKLSLLKNCPPDAAKGTVYAFVDASVFKSCHALTRSSLEVLMLHRANHLEDHNGVIWQRLLELRDLGVIKHLGVSIQNPGELQNVLGHPEIEFVQLPFNILDWRWKETVELISRIKSERPLTVHARSIYLQGLLTTGCSRLWHRANCTESQIVQQWLQELADRFTSGSVKCLCLLYAASQSWIDGLVVGVETMEQLRENLSYLDRDPLALEDLQSIDASRPLLSEITLNPAKWN